jgi:hypothetical protein
MCAAVILAASAVGDPLKQAAPSAGEARQLVQPKPASRNQQTSADEHGADKAPLVIKVLPSDNANVEAAERAQERQDKSALDRRTLELNDRMVLLTGGLLAVAFLQVIFLGWQTRRLRQTVETMRGTEQRSLRAYVGVDALAFDTPDINNAAYVPDADPLPPGFTFRNFLSVTVKNFGETPAKDVCVFAYYANTEYPTRLPDDFFDHDANNTDIVSAAATRSTLARYLLQRGQSEVSKSRLQTILPLREAIADRRNIYVFGRVYYRDAYNRPWRTKFCFQWEPNFHSGPRFVPYETYNDEDQNELLYEEPAPPPPAVTPVALAP